MTTQDESRDRWRRISSLFDEAVKLSPGERPAFLEAACGSDLDLRDRVAALLDAGDQSEDFLNKPLLSRARALFRQGIENLPPGTASQPPAGGDDDSTLTAAASGRPAGEIGPYRLLERIGEGGMGEVWLAEQSGPIRRRVALKLIKAGMDTRQVIARFEAERQALALMEHPAIARVYEAGETPRGLPFFAMEHIQGEPITVYADRHRLTMPERLALFARVCEGVQHAHQKGIIHRDLKPSNVLVTIVGNEPMPKIIDFGVAKATAQRLTEKTMFTEMGVLLGTPEYMSPEQAEMTGLDVDTRTDVYALGAILYELLTGALPFEPKDLRRAGYDEIRRRIREVNPPRPSTRVRTLGERSTEAARNRRTEPHRLVSRLKGDLDWIVMKALEKDRTRRYGGPSDLAADLARHLGHEPVLAGPPGAIYRTGKFVRRHRLSVAAATLVLAGVVAFGVTMALQARAIARERDRAERASNFLLNLFKVDDFRQANADSVTAREILDRGASRVEKQLGKDPLLQARLMTILGEVYVYLGVWSEAEKLLRKADAMNTRTLGADAEGTLHPRLQLAMTLANQGRHKEAEAIDAALVETWRRLKGPEHRSTLMALFRLGVDYQMQGRLEEAERVAREVLAAQKRVLGDEQTDTLWSEVNLGVVLQGLGRPAEAEPHFRQAYDGMKRVRGPEDRDTLTVGNSLAGFYTKQQRYADAEPICREILEVRKRVLGPENPATLGSLMNLTNVIGAQGRIAEAEEGQRQLLEITRRVRGKDHVLTLRVMLSLAGTLMDARRYDEAERLLLDAHEGFMRTLGPSHADTLASTYTLACLDAQRGRLRDAVGWLRKTVDAGYSDADYMEKDSDLAPLRPDAAFQRLLADARANRARTDGAKPEGDSLP